VLGKGGKERTFQIPAALWRELEDLTPNRRPESPVLPGRDGRPMDRQAIHKIVKRAARRIGRPEASSHWLRHCCASHALDRNAPVHVVQQQLGHASLKTTSLYAHAAPGESASSYLPE
jgi:integrase/recombinase XerD